MQKTEDQTTRTESNNIAVISYLTVIGLIIAFVMNNDKKEPFASFHIKQSLGLLLTALALSMIGIIPILGWLIDIIGFIVLFYMWIVGLLNAVNGKENPVPLLGKSYIKWLNNLNF